jgi:hypothetical protein
MHFLSKRHTALVAPGSADFAQRATTAAGSIPAVPVYHAYTWRLV